MTRRMRCDLRFVAGADYAAPRIADRRNGGLRQNAHADAPVKNCNGRRRIRRRRAAPLGKPGRCFAGERKSAPLVGRVSMDQCQIDVTDCEPDWAGVGSVVTFIGHSETGEAQQTVLDLSRNRGHHAARADVPPIAPGSPFISRLTDGLGYNKSQSDLDSYRICRPFFPFPILRPDAILLSLLSPSERADAQTVADFCRARLNLDAAAQSDGTRPAYAHLPLCVIDSVWSLSVRYESVRNVVARYAAHADLDAPKDGDMPEHTVSDFVRTVEAVGVEDFASLVLQNKQRTASKSGILKADAGVSVRARFAGTRRANDFRCFRKAAWQCAV